MTRCTGPTIPFVEYVFDKSYRLRIRRPDHPKPLIQNQMVQIHSCENRPQDGLHILPSLN